jgi:hypothetical protein
MVKGAVVAVAAGGGFSGVAVGKGGKANNGGGNGGETGYAGAGPYEPVEDGECSDGYKSQVFSLWAGQDNDAGTVTVSNDEDNIYVTYDTNESADLKEVHVDVYSTADAVPDKRPAPGQAQYKAEELYTDSYTVTVPFADLGETVECGDDYYVIAHTALTSDDASDDGEDADSDLSNDGETAYAGGSEPYDDKGKGAWFYVAEYIIECCSYDISGSVYDDADGDSGLDDGESGLGGRTVTLVDDAGAVATTTTDSDGSYTFEDILGGEDYTVVVDAPDGYVGTQNSSGYEITDLDGDLTDVDFGFTEEGVCVDFSSLDAGTSVEGLGAVHPFLNIQSQYDNGNVVVSKTETQPGFYGSTDALNSPAGTLNGCLGAGFADKWAKNNAEPHKYNFSFDGTVSQFSLRMLDFGDLNRDSGAVTHEVTMTASDGSGTAVDDQLLKYTSDGGVNPDGWNPATESDSTIKFYDSLGNSGDACTAELGEPGNYVWNVSGEGISEIDLSFGQGYDPNIAFMDLCFTIEETAPDFTYNVETDFGGQGDTDGSGTIKFESTSEPALGEDGVSESDSFTFTAGCEDDELLVETKNQDTVSETITPGETVTMSNGFDVTWDSLTQNDDGTWEYEFTVSSDADNTTGALSYVAFDTDCQAGSISP